MDLRIATFLSLTLACMSFRFAGCRRIQSDASNFDQGVRLDARRTQLREQLDQKISVSVSFTTGHTHDVEKECVDFLIAHMPARDLDDPEVTTEFLLRQTRLALAARNATNWARTVPWFFPDPAKLQSPGSELCNGSSIYASSWAPTPEGKFWPLYWLMDNSTGECLENARYVNAYDVTRSYLELAESRTNVGTMSVDIQ
eukprot:1190820-Prorocentrum_minimum.AAC.3